VPPVVPDRFDESLGLVEMELFFDVCPALVDWL